MARNDGLIIRAIDRATAVLRLTQRRITALFAPLQRLQQRLSRLARAAGLNKLADGFKGVGKGLGRVGAEAKKVFGGIAAGAAAAAAAVTLFVNAQTEAGNELGNTADRVGLTVDAYAQYKYAADQFDVAQEKLISGLETFNKSLGEARVGKGKLISFLKDVSPSFLKALKGAKNTEAALSVAFKAFDRIQDPAKKAALALKLFGSVDFVQFVTGGSDAIQKFREEFQKGEGSVQDFVDGSRELDGQMDVLNRTFGGLSRIVATQLFPSFAEFASTLNRFLEENREEIRAWSKVAGDKLLQFAKDLPGYIQKIGAKFDEMKTKLKPLADRVGGFANLLGIVAGLIVFGPLIGAIGSLSIAFVALGVAIATTPIGWILAGLTALVAAAAWLVEDWEPVKEFFVDLWDGVKKAFSGFADFLGGVFALDMKRVWEGLKKIFTGNFEITKAALKLPMTIVKAFTGKDEAQPADGAVTKAGLPQRPTIGAVAARPQQQSQPAASTQTNNATVTVDFKNTPAGTKIRPGRDNTAPLQLNVGRVLEIG